MNIAWGLRASGRKRKLQVQGSVGAVLKWVEVAAEEPMRRVCQDEDGDIQGPILGQGEEAKGSRGRRGTAGIMSFAAAGALTVTELCKQ